MSAINFKIMDKREILRNKAAEVENEVGPITVGLLQFMKLSDSHLGYLVEVMSSLERILNTTFVYISTNDTELGRPENGSWGGQLGSISSGGYTTTLPYVTPSDARSHIVAFTTPVYTGQYYIYSRRPIPDDIPLRTLFPFSWLFWLFLFGSIILIGLLHPLFSQSPGLKGTTVQAQGVGKSLRQGYGVGLLLMSQGSSSLDKFKGPARFSLGLWGIATVALTGSYSGTLLVNLLQEKFIFPFTNMEEFGDCLSQRQCILMTETPDSNFMEEVKESKSPSPLVSVRNGLTKTPSMRVKRANDAEWGEGALEEMPLNWRPQYLTHFMDQSRITHHWPMENKRCRFFFVPTGVSSDSAFPFKIGSPWYPLFNEAIYTLHQSGLLTTGDSFTAIGCGAERDKAINLEAGKGVPIYALRGVFIVLFLGLIFSFPILFAEKTIHVAKCIIYGSRKTAKIS